MICALRRLAVAVALPLVVAACAGTGRGTTAADAGPVPVGFRIALGGETGPILAEDGTGQIALRRKGEEEAVTLGFTNDGLVAHPLAPGRYEITRLGPLQCRGLAFEVGARPRHLGTLRAKVVRTDYHVALMQPAVADPPDVAALAGQAGTEPEAVDAEPIAIREAAPCFLGRDGPVTTWDDLTLGEKIMLGAGVAGLCAISLAAGGFCQF